MGIQRHCINMQRNIMLCLFVLEGRREEKNDDRNSKLLNNNNREKNDGKREKNGTKISSKIDKMTSIDINIILVLFTENEKGKKM